MYQSTQGILHNPITNPKTDRMARPDETQDRRPDTGRPCQASPKPHGWARKPYRTPHCTPDTRDAPAAPADDTVYPRNLKELFAEDEGDKKYPRNTAELFAED